MSVSRWHRSGSVSLAVACLLAGGGGGAVAQEVVAPGYVTIPALGGAVDLNALPPEVRDNIRIPGVEYDEPEPEYRDLPPLNSPEEPELSGATQIETTEDAQGAAAEASPDLLPDAALETDEPSTRDENLKALFDQPASPDGAMPEDAYRRAWEHIEQMPAAAPPSTAPLADEPLSWLERPSAWLTGLWQALAPPLALAQSGQWYPIGPSTFLEDNGAKFAGLVNAITVDPQNSNRIYLGTFLGGIWKTNSGGIPMSGLPGWTTTTDNAPSLQNDTIAVHPSNANVVIAGTGGIDFPPYNVGSLRSTDQASSWSQIGPTWCIQPSDPSSTCQAGQSPCKSGTTCVISDPSLCSCTAPSKSNLAVVELAMDDSQSPVRLWAATSRGLWYSDNAANSATPPTQIRWNRVVNFPQAGSGEMKVNHVLLSPWNKQLGSQVLYASVVNHPTLNGWYRSKDRGDNWIALTNGDIPADPQIRRAAISSGGQFFSVDIIYSIVGDVPTTCNGLPAQKPRLFKLAVHDTAHLWTLIAANKSCTASTDSATTGCARARTACAVPPAPTAATSDS